MRFRSIQATRTRTSISVARTLRARTTFRRRRFSSGLKSVSRQIPGGRGSPTGWGGGAPGRAEKPADEGGAYQRAPAESPGNLPARGGTTGLSAFRPPPAAPARAPVPAADLDQPAP